MFKYTKAAVDIIVNDVRRYCNMFKYGAMLFTLVYFIYSIYTKNGNLIVNIVLLSLFSLYAILDLLTSKKDYKFFKRFIRKSYKGLKITTKAFSLGVMIYGIYIATYNVAPISIILATLMIIMWVLEVLFEIVLSIFEDKKDLLVAGWNKDVENLKRPVTTVNNFIRKVKGEEIIESNNSSREIKILERKIKKEKVNS